MSAFFLGRWLALGKALVGDGFGGHQVAYIDCPLITVPAAEYTTALVEADEDTAISAQAGCED